MYLKTDNYYVYNYKIIFNYIYISIEILDFVTQNSQISLNFFKVITF